MPEPQGWIAHARRVADIYDKHGMPSKAEEWRAAASAVEEELVPVE